MAKFYTSYMSEQKECDWLTEYAIINTSEYDEIEHYLISKNRSIKGISESNIYQVYCMTFYPIETLIERKKKIQREIEKEIENIENNFQKLLDK